MSMLIQAISRTTDQGELFAQLNVFLRKLAESGVARGIPLDLRPLEISSGSELQTWLHRVESEVDRRQAAGQLGEETLRFLQYLLQAAAERDQFLSR